MSDIARARIAVMHGVNLDQLGRRDPAHYGGFSFRDLEAQIQSWGDELGLSLRFFQTNHEGEFVEFLHSAEGLVDGLILNPGAWTHYSWAIRDAVELAALPTVEVHLSDVGSRESWRQLSVLEGLVVQKISGKGADGYKEALAYLQSHIAQPGEASA